MWIVRLTDHPGPYGPFDDEQQAQRFADFLTAEVDPAIVEPLLSPLNEVLNWRDATQQSARPTWQGGPAWGPTEEATYREQSSRPSVRGGARLHPSDEDGYREEQGT